MFVVDTNILFYAADKDSPHHDACAAFLEVQRKSTAPWSLTWGIVYEFIRISTHSRVLRKPWTAAQARTFIEVLVMNPRITILGESEYHLKTLETLLAEHPRSTGNLIFDARTVAIMRENGIRTIYTRDTDFYRFRGIEVIDPAA